MQALYTGLQAVYWICSSCAMVYAAVYLKYHGFGSEITGIVSSLSFLLSIIVTHCMGARQSKKRQSSVPYLRTLAFFLIPAELALLFLEKNGHAIPYLLIFITCVLLSIKGILNRLYDELKQDDVKLDFASSRAAGSISFAACSFFLGFLIGKNNPDIMVPALIIFSIVLVALIFRLPQTDLQTPGKQDASGFEKPVFWKYPVLFLACAIIFAVQNTLATFQIYIISDAGGNPADLGMLTLLSSILEAPAMYAFLWLKKRFNTSAVLGFSLLAFPVRFMFFACATDMTFIYISVIFQLLSFGLYTPSIVEFIIEKFSKEKSGAAQLLINNMASLGSIVAILFSGFLIRSFPAQSVILVLSVAAGFAAVLACFSIWKN